MCEFCKLEQIGKDEYRQENLDPIINIKDGSQTMEVYLNRYISKSDNANRALLILDHSVIPDGSRYLIDYEELKIKYCPFCGEKLV